MDGKLIINYITTFLILLPISWGFKKLRPASFAERSVLFFLIIGFVVDVTGMFYKILRTDLVIWYAGFESVFFLVFLRHYFKDHSVRLVLTILSVAFGLLWYISFFVFTNEASAFAYSRQFFDMLYTLLASCFSGFLLLKMIEEADVFLKPVFWMVMAIFVYCFCSFFISAFIRDEIVEKIWYVHNLISIVALVIFTKAFSLVKSS